MDVVNVSLTLGSALIASFLIFGMAASFGGLAPQPAFAESSIRAPAEKTSNYAVLVRLNARF